MTGDARVDAYIAKAAPFAQPILAHLRALVHRTLPEVEEGIKWGMPHFMLGGKNVAGMSAFKAHCAFIIHGEGRGGSDGMGHLGKLTAIDDLPPEKELTASLLDAANRIASTGSAVKSKAKVARRPAIAMPEDFANALAGNEAAKANLERFAHSHKRDYLEWITEAKRAETRNRRIEQAVMQLAEGKRRHWKYENC